MHVRWVRTAVRMDCNASSSAKQDGQRLKCRRRKNRRNPPAWPSKKSRQKHPGLLMVHRNASCLCQALRNASLARDRRDITVPPGTPVTSAISL